MTEPASSLASPNPAPQADAAVPAPVAVLPAATISTPLWALSLALAAAAAWGLMNYLPWRFTMPPELTTGTVANSPELSARAAQTGITIGWKNGLVSMALVGAMFGGIPPLLCLRGGLRKGMGVLVGLAAGGGCGMAAFATGRAVQSYWHSGGGGELDEPSMYGDLLIYAAMSILIALPAGGVFLMQESSNAIQRFFAVPLAGLLAGLLLPVVASFVLPDVKIDSLPPSDVVFSGLWLAAIAVLVFLMTMMTGDRSATS